MIKYRQKYPLTFSLILKISLFSIIFTFFISILVSYIEYRKELKKLEELIMTIKQSSLENITTSLWRFDNALLAIQLNNVLRIPYLKYTEIINNKGERIIALGKHPSGKVSSWQFVLYYKSKTRNAKLGTLSIIADIDEIYKNFYIQYIKNFGIQALQIFFVSIFIFILVHSMIIKHLMAIAQYAQHIINFNGLDKTLSIHRSRFNNNYLDELDRVVNAINGMRLNLLKEIEAQNHVKEELIKAKKEAEESEARLRTLSDNIPNGMVYQIDFGVDAQQRRFTYISAGVERLHGISASDALNDAMALYGQVVEEEDRHILAEHEAMAATNMSQFNAEVKFQLPSGKIRWGHITAAPRRLPNNHLIWDGIEIDITELKKSQDALIESEVKLQQAQKMEAIGVLAGGIAHDFNNILSPIIGHTEMLSDDIPKDSPLRSSLDEIYAASMRAKDMVRQILTFARQEKSEVMLIKMQHIVKEALKLIRSTIPATIGIKDNIRKECGLINADPTQIHQIVMNLVTNAYHAMEETGGTMTISLKEVELNPELNEQDLIGLIGQDIQKGIYACLTISDTGTGISEDVKDKIFDPFFTTKEQGKGTGLGLSSVHGIVTNCGGFIRLNSEIGKGTEFNIYLPVAESYLKKNEVLQAKIPMQGGNEHLLLVDDEVVLITLQKGLLERLGYQVTSRTSSIEALEAFRANPDKFDVVITDMAMPNMSGDKLAVELIKIRPDIPILLCTGFSTIMSEEKALSMGIKGFLMKPVTITDLDKKIRDVIKPNKLRE